MGEVDRMAVIERAITGDEWKQIEAQRAAAAVVGTPGFPRYAVLDLAGELVRLRNQLAGAVEALTTLANPTHKPRTEEAALVQIEVVQIAQDALAHLGGQ